MKSRAKEFFTTYSPLIGLIAAFCAFIPLMFLFLPDSLHIMLLGALALILSSFAAFYFNNNKNKPASVAERILYILSLVIWIICFYPVFFLYSISYYFNIAAFVIYSGAITWLCIYCGNEKRFRTVKIIASTIPVCFLHYISVLTLVLTHQLYAVTLFLGSSVYGVLIFIYIINKIKKQAEKRTAAEIILFISAELLLPASLILMAGIRF